MADILTHQAGLKAWIPFWKTTVATDGLFKKKTLSQVQSKKYPYCVAPDLYVRKNYSRKLYRQIKKSEVKDTVAYVYSDLSFYIYPKVVESITEQSFETYLKQNIYEPLGAYKFTYNAYKVFSLEEIIPTEIDTFFRKTMLQGYVHDEGAALLGGISGHAGLFADADDLAKLMQTYLNKGTYGGIRYFNEQSINEFTSCPNCETGNRRGIVFDKPLIGNRDSSFAKAYPTPEVSESSFGHSGYTGTFVWMDPENGLLYIFLSNRVFPTRDNSKIFKYNVRPSIHQVFYQSLTMI